MRSRLSLCGSILLLTLQGSRAAGRSHSRRAAVRRRIVRQPVGADDRHEHGELQERRLHLFADDVQVPRGPHPPDDVRRGTDRNRKDRADRRSLRRKRGRGILKTGTDGRGIQNGASGRRRVLRHDRRPGQPQIRRRIADRNHAGPDRSFVRPEQRLFLRSSIGLQRADPYLRIHPEQRSANREIAGRSSAERRRDRPASRLRLSHSVPAGGKRNAKGKPSSRDVYRERCR